MALIEAKRIPWKPELAELMEKLDVPAPDAPLFERAYREATRRYSPCVHYQTARLEATGDSFVLLSGVFIDEEKVARALIGADRVFAFTVLGVEADADTEWLSTLSETAARDCAHAWIDGLTRQTGERFRIIFFPQSKEWTDLFSLPNDHADRLFGVAYTTSCGGCSCGNKKCAYCCPKKVQ